MNFRLFLFLLYIFPGRSKEKVVKHFPKHRKNMLIYDANNCFFYFQNGKYYLSDSGEKKLFKYLTIVGGFVVGASAIAAVIIA